MIARLGETVAGGGPAGLDAFGVAGDLRLDPPFALELEKLLAGRPVAGGLEPELAKDLAFAARLSALAEALSSALPELAVVLALLPEDRTVSFSDITRGAVDRLDVIVRFLAVLELYKQGVVELEQVATFADLSVRRLTTGEALDAVSIADWDTPLSAPTPSGRRGGS